jgi:DNA-binding GntR family transcriptional regulator
MSGRQPIRQRGQGRRRGEHLESDSLNAGPEPALNRVAEAYRTIRDVIVRGKLAPGTRIIESDLAARLEVSRTPVRAALLRLQREGYVVECGEGRRTRLMVAPLTASDAADLFDMAGEIEGLAGRYAAQLEGRERGRVVAQLTAVNGDLRREAEKPRPDGNLLYQLDEAFHRTYVEAAARARLLAWHDAVKPQAERYIRVYLSALVDEIATSVQEHGVIVEAIGAGDPDGAQRAVQTNWRNAAVRLSRVIDRVGERGSW